MSWQPPPSFAPGDSSSRTPTRHTGTGTHSPTQTNRNSQSPKKDDKNSRARKSAWAPPTSFAPPPIVAGEESNKIEPAAAPQGMIPGNLSLDSFGPKMVQAPPSSALRSKSPKPRSPNISPGAGYGKQPVSNKKVVGWNQALFVVDQEGGDTAAPAENSEEQDADDDEFVIEVPSRGALGFNKSFFSKRELLVVDEALLRTRLEWSQLLVSKALKPYRQMICAVDDDLPNPKDLEEMEEAASNEDYLGGEKELIKIRDEMLFDPDLNEKLIAAFFEGYKLFQMKTNSLQSQLDGMKAMQKAGLRTGFSSTRNLKSERFVPTSALAASIVPQRNPSMPEFQGKRGLGTLNENGPSTIVPPVRSTDNDDNSKEALGDQKSTRHSTRESRAQAKPRGLAGAGASRSIRQMSIQRIREATTGNDDIRKLLEELEEAERRQKKLEKQLAQAGVTIAEDIPYEVAKEKVASIARRMGEIGGSDVGEKKLQEEYYLLERDMEKYTSALQLTDEWIAEQEETERQWEESVIPCNEEAIKKLRRHLPVDVRNRSEAMLCSEPTPNGKYLPKNIAKKFKRTNVLQLLRMDPADIVPMHAATLENMRVTGLTLTERRAMYHHLKDIGPRWKAMQGDKMTERKWTWFNMMKSNFKENVDSWQRHVDQFGPPGDHPYATSDNPDSGCPLIGKQCPLKADTMIDYDGDYGFPEGPEYFKFDVKKSEVENISKARQEAQEALKQKKSEERGNALKEHYKGKILQVSLANGSCELMDETMDTLEDVQEKWLKARLSNSASPTDDSRKKEMTGFNEALNEMKLSILQFAERSGMQLTGKRDANADQPDIRSMIELSLCEEVIETAFDFFEGIEERMIEMKLKDGRMKVTIEQLRTLIEELQERNHNTIESLGQERPPRSRELKSRVKIAAKVEIEEKAKAPSESTPNGLPAGTPGPGGGGGGPGSGDLLSALKGRGRRGGGPGRGDLLSALQGRGGRGEGGGRGGLMAAICRGQA